MKITLFSVEEANRVANEIRPSLAQLVRTKQEFDRLQSRIDALTLATSGAVPTNPDQLELRRATEKRGAISSALRRGIQAVQARGVVVKDLGRGLVDFYSLVGDRLIFLCWQIEEAEVSHWHTLEGGFAGRQPLHRTEQE